MSQEAEIQALRDNVRELQTEIDRLRADIQKVSHSLMVYHSAVRQISRGGVTPEDVRQIVKRTLSVWPGES